MKPVVRTTKGNRSVRPFGDSSALLRHREGGIVGHAFLAPLTSFGPRDLVEKKPRPVPKAVKDAVTLMVYGKPDDPDGRPVDFIEAGRACGIKPDIMRRWLDRPAVRALLHAERRAFRAAICAGNELSLARVRDRSENGMAVIGLCGRSRTSRKKPRHGHAASIRRRLAW